jgi:23S rRNA pseudouridine955/2504/2580 synthase
VKNNIEKSKVTIITIPEEFSGQRLDNFLANKLKGVPKSRIYRMLRKGEVRVNKKRVLPSYRIQSDDLLRLPPFWTLEKEAPVSAGPNTTEKLLQSIIYEDPNFLIINKPAGFASHGGSGISLGVIEALRLIREDCHYLELGHRLDRETSGCLVIAKKRSALRTFHALLREGKVLKTYQLLVFGKWPRNLAKVDLPLQKGQLSSGERMVKVKEEGKFSVTIFNPKIITKNLSFLEATLKTGRTHQIRVHATSVGHPIVGDEKYGDQELNKKMRKQGVKRLFLHAALISFVLPETKQKIEVKAHLPLNLKKIIEDLKNEAISTGNF